MLEPPARADQRRDISAGPSAGRRAQVGGADGRPSGQGREPAGLGPLRHFQPVGCGACPGPAGLAHGAGHQTHRAGHRRHRLPQGRRRLGVRGQAVHRYRGRGHQLPGRRLPSPGLQRRLGGGELASVPARQLGSLLTQGRSGQSGPPRQVRHLCPGGPCRKVAADPRHDRRDAVLGHRRAPVIADGGYGDTAAFRLGLETRGLDYVVGISTTTTARPEDARPSTPT